MSSHRHIPAVDQLLQRRRLRASADAHGQARVTAAVRSATVALRALIDRHAEEAPVGASAMVDWLEAAVLEELASDVAASLRAVINATGVIIHTNLGRAPLAADALTAISRLAGRYTNLEYALDAGRRGDRHVHAERLLTRLTGAEAALVTNNNAAAALVVLAALADGREVLVSRGELIEIGGGFRVPEVMAQSGARLREVGTTNRTRTADYGAAINSDTGLLLRVHPSNFRMDGFTERPTIEALAALAHQFDLPLVEDLGSGWLFDDAAGVAALDGEPSVQQALRSGADVVMFSGDKLLGGPQAGLIVGRRTWLDRIRHHPLMRAVRADKMTYAALEATLSLWLRVPARDQIPVYRMLTATLDDLASRATSLAARLESISGLTVRLRDGHSTIGGGSAPGSALPTTLVAIRSETVSASELHDRLRQGSPAVVGRIEAGELLLDVRTVEVGEDEDLLGALRAGLGADG